MAQQDQNFHGFRSRKKGGFILVRMVENVSKSLELLFVKGEHVVFKELDLFC